MLVAIEAVRNDELCCKENLEFLGQPGTRQDRIHGRISHGTNPGPKLYLTQAEE